MRLEIILVSVIIVLSAWSLNTFLRLKAARNEYPSDDAYEDACHVSITYTKGGEVIAALVLGLSGLLLGFLLYKDYMSLLIFLFVQNVL